MKKIKLIKNDIVITGNAEIADGFFSRFRGLMFRKSIAEDYALFITPCNQIHMLNMKFAIDAVYLSESGEVVKIEENLQPGIICKAVKNAASVVELKGFSASKLDISIGDIIVRVRD